METYKLYFFLIAYLFYSAESHYTCVPRSFTYPVPYSSSSTPPSSPPPQSSPPQAASSSPPQVSSPPPQVSSPPPPVNSPPSPSYPKITLSSLHINAVPQQINFVPHLTNDGTSNIAAAAIGLPNPLLKSVCDKTLDPNLCVSSVTPFLTGQFDPLTILHLQIQASVNITNVAKETATKIAQDPSTDPSVSKILTSCKSQYDDILDELKKVVDALAARDVGTVKSCLSAAITESDSCEDGFSDMGKSNSPMVDLDQRIHDLVGLCLDLVNLVH